MTVRIVAMTEAEAARIGTDPEAGLGALHTQQGNLPLDTIEVRATITGLVARTTLTQGYRNPFDVPLEATYVFPLPDRAAVTGMRMAADGRVVEAELRERAEARRAYHEAIQHGQRASIAEEERPDVFTMRVGNILPGERVEVTLTFVGSLPYEDGEATYRLPLVVAPRYIPGTPLPGDPVGDGYAEDTDAVPDASRITPPVLLPGFPNPVRLGVEVEIEPAGLPLSEVRSSLHTVDTEEGRVRIRPGERVNRDFVLRLGYGSPDGASHSLTVTSDAEGDEGTFRLTVLPPTTAAPARPRDLVLVLDRSGSMAGWKMVAARRTAGRIVDTLTGADRFAVLTFDNTVETPPGLGAGLVEASDRNRFRAVEHLARTQARGGTEMLGPLRDALRLLSLGDSVRDRVLVLVTDGQVGNEDQILGELTKQLAGVRMHTVGIDQAVNAGFLGRMAVAGGGRCELVESEDRLDAAMERIHRRIGAPLVTGLKLTAEGLDLVDDTVSPARLPDLFPGAPLVVTGRYRRGTAGAATIRGTGRDGEWSAHVAAVPATDPAPTSVWARAHLRDLEDRYLADVEGREALERRIVATSLRFGVLCRFTAWLAIDTRVVTEGGTTHRVTQPVEPPAGWDMFGAPDAGPPMLLAASASAAGPAAYGMTFAARPAPSGGLAQARLGRSLGGRPGRARRQAPAPLREAGDGSAAVTAELAAARAQAAAEARLLRQAAGTTPFERRQILADVGSRLAALVRHLTTLALVQSLVLRARALVAELEADRPLGVPEDVFEDLWTRTLSFLDELASPPEPARRTEFWKR